MTFTWTLLFARAKDLLDGGDFYGFMLFVSFVIDAAVFFAVLAKAGVVA